MFPLGMADNNEQLRTAVQILAQIADRALVDGPSSRQRDQAVQLLAQHFGLATQPAAPEVIVPPEPEGESD